MVAYVIVISGGCAVSSLSAQVATFRAFNRFHTRLVGALDRHILDSPHSLTESRVLYEIARENVATASDLAKVLRLDPAYLSRALRKLEDAGLIEKSPSATDRRATALRLTGEGRTTFDALDRAADAQAATLLEPLAATEREGLAKAMARVMTSLSETPVAPGAVVIRQPEPGDIGWIVYRHGALYASEYGWDETFEGLVAEIAGAFLRSHNPRRERCWVAERSGDILGSVFVVDAGEGVAKLRLLYVEPGARGLGLGRRLVGEALRFARVAGYCKMTLWTNDVLTAARRIYESAGFRLVSSEPHRSFGKDLVGECWETAL
jgi:DNA-binding MarR family transcriptional regulator/GNAT superfamily N-acetyltransferase